jgi:hypothetical protein
MTYAITPYAVSLTRLKQVIGSGDAVLLNEILIQQDDFLSGIDMIDEDCEFRCSQALMALVCGDINNEIPGYLYGYAFKALCAHLGTELSDISGIAGAYDWIAEIDAGKQDCAVRLQLADLVYSGSPIAIPAPADFPVIGCWDVKTIAPALDDFHQVDFSTLDSDVAETMQQMKAWLTTARKISDASIVGFLA